MKQAVTIVGFLVLVVLVLLVVWRRPKPVPKDITIRLAGTSGLTVTGKVTVDGVTAAFSGVLPTNLVYRARSVAFGIKKTTDAGELKATLDVPGELSLSSEATKPFEGIQARYGYAGWLWPRPVNYITSLLKEE
jgi:hypothetical protein